MRGIFSLQVSVAICWWSISVCSVKVDAQLKTYNAQSEQDRFIEIMAPFISNAKLELETIEGLHATMVDSFTKLATYFAFDQVKYTMEEFFADMKLFKDQYEVVTSAAAAAPSAFH